MKIEEAHTQLISNEIAARKLCSEQQIKFSIYLFTDSTVEHMQLRHCTYIMLDLKVIFNFSEISNT